jgi:hypothetical protein
MDERLSANGKGAYVYSPQGGSPPPTWIQSMSTEFLLTNSLEHSKNPPNSNGSFQSEPDFLTRESFGPCFATMQSVRHSDTVNTFLSPRTTTCTMHTANGETRDCGILASLL